MFFPSSSNSFVFTLQQPQQVTELIRSEKNGRISFASDTIKHAQIPKLFNKSQKGACRSQKTTASIFNYSLFITDTLLLIVFQEQPRVSQALTMAVHFFKKKIKKHLEGFPLLQRKQCNAKTGSFAKRWTAKARKATNPPTPPSTEGLETKRLHFKCLFQQPKQMKHPLNASSRRSNEPLEVKLITAACVCVFHRHTHTHSWLSVPRRRIFLSRMI